MIVESKVLLNDAKSTDYITCSKCSGESKRISSKLKLTDYGAYPQEFKTEIR
jgi:hypothetical protein